MFCYNTPFTVFNLHLSSNDSVFPLVVISEGRFPAFVSSALRPDLEKHLDCVPFAFLTEVFLSHNGSSTSSLKHAALWH